MNSYSLGGYLAALRIRGNKNLLLEGPTDLKIVARVVAEMVNRGEVDLHGITIDTVDIINDPEIPPGNRAAVEYVYNLAEAERLPIAAVVDREYRKFVVNDVEIRDDLSSHFQQNDLYWTRGHSIENYFFDSGYFEAYLRMKHPESIPHLCYAVIQSEFPTLMRGAAAASLAAMRCSVVERCGGICSLSMWEVTTPNQLCFTIDELLDALESRGVDQTVLSTFSELFQEYDKQLSSVTDVYLTRWISHGHVGWSFVWAGIGRLLLHCGVNQEIAESVGRGFMDDKIRFFANRWAVEALEGMNDSPTALWDWLRVA